LPIAEPMKNRFLFPGLIGIWASATGAVIFVLGAVSSVDGIAAAGMALAATGFFLGIGQVLELPRAMWSYPILVACVTPMLCFYVFVVPRIT